MQEFRSRRLFCEAGIAALSAELLSGKAPTLHRTAQQRRRAPPGYRPWTKWEPVGC